MSLVKRGERERGRDLPAAPAAVIPVSVTAGAVAGKVARATAAEAVVVGGTTAGALGPLHNDACATDLAPVLRLHGCECVVAYTLVCVCVCVCLLAHMLAR